MNAQNNPQPTQSTPNPKQFPKSKPSVGSLFAGIGGFDLGFEQAGFYTSWQVEIDPICRAVLSDRFPHATQFEDVTNCLPQIQALPNGGSVDVIVGGFPCQDVSMAGKRAGLNGKRTGLFFDAVHIVKAIKPKYLVLENVTGLINSNNGEDLQTVIKTLAQCGYVGFWRVLDSRYFGVPQKRRRVFLVAGLGEYPPFSFMLTPDQWHTFVARLARNRPGRMHTLRYLQGSEAVPSISTVPTSSLLPTDGIRWLSGSERLSLMGFAKDWMRPTLHRLGLREMPSVRKLQGGLQAT